MVCDTKAIGPSGSSSRTDHSASGMSTGPKSRGATLTIPEFPVFAMSPLMNAASIIPFRSSMTGSRAGPRYRSTKAAWAPVKPISLLSPSSAIWSSAHPVLVARTAAVQSPEPSWSS